MSAVLQIRALSKRLHAGVPGCAATALVLGDVWLDVAAGERVALCSRDATARSALLLCAAGLMRADAGSVQLRGAAAYVAGDPPSLGGLTVAELLEWHRRTLIARDVGMSTQALAPSAALRAADCESLADVRVRLLSPTSARRVAVARALVARPSLLAVDAPSHAPSHARSEARDEMDRTLARVAGAGVAVLFSADADATLAAGVRAIWLRDRGLVVPPMPRRRRADGRDGSSSAARRAVAEQAAPTI